MEHWETKKGKIEEGKGEVGHRGERKEKGRRGKRKEKEHQGREEKKRGRVEGKGKRQ